MVAKLTIQSAVILEEETMKGSTVAESTLTSASCNVEKYMFITAKKNKIIRVLLTPQAILDFLVSTKVASTL